MKSFYDRHLGSGERASKALRDSKLEFLRSLRRSGVAPLERSVATPGSHPYSWASYVLIGVPPG